MKSLLSIGLIAVCALVALAEPADAGFRSRAFNRGFNRGLKQGQRQNRGVNVNVNGVRVRAR